MEQRSQTRKKERPQLIAARKSIPLSQEEVAKSVKASKSAVHRWEKEGDVPQPEHLRSLRSLFGRSLQELGFTEAEVGGALWLELEENCDDHEVMQQQEGPDDELMIFRKQHYISRFTSLGWSWSSTNYRMLESVIATELESGATTMTDDELLHRRDAIKFLALVPVDLLGLSERNAVIRGSYEEILKHCTAGIVACRYLSRSGELVFADSVVSKYIPTLKAIVRVAALPQQRIDAADLLAQCFLLKSGLAMHVTPTSMNYAMHHANAIRYAQQAETYSTIAQDPFLQIVALRRQAAAFYYANQWEQAFTVTEKAKALLLQTQKSSVSLHEKKVPPLPSLVQSYVYGGLAVFQAYHGERKDALVSLKKAHQMFFQQSADDDVTIVPYSVGSLLLNENQTQLYRGEYDNALQAVGQLQKEYVHDPTISAANRVESCFEQVKIEVRREDQPRRMDWCIEQWEEGVKRAKKLRSQHLLEEAIRIYGEMCVAWPREQRTKNLRKQIVNAPEQKRRTDEQK